MHAHTIANEIIRAEEALPTAKSFIGIFGSGNIDSKHPYYQKAYELALGLIEQGFSILTGGGGGVMEAANSGAHTGKGISAGLCLKFKGYEKKNRFIDPGLDLEFSSFFSRKATFLNHVKGVVVFPGGIGTLDELFEVLLAIRAKKIESMPIYLIGKKFWAGLIDWLTSNVFGQDLAPKELQHIIKMTDEIDIVIKELQKMRRAAQGLAKGL